MSSSDSAYTSSTFLFLIICPQSYFFFFFFNDTATTEIYPLSYTTLFRSLEIDDALPELVPLPGEAHRRIESRSEEHTSELQSQSISYAVFCLKKKKNTILTSSLHPTLRRV